MQPHEFIGRASATARLPYENSLMNEVVDIAIGCILRAMVNLIPLGRSELAFKTIQQHIDDLALTVVEGYLMVTIPKYRRR